MAGRNVSFREVLQRQISSMQEDEFVKNIINKECNPVCVSPEIVGEKIVKSISEDTKLSEIQVRAALDRVSLRCAVM